MSEVQWVARPRGSPRSVAGLLGSFDPPHLGHGWIVKQLLDRFDQVALLIPTQHFEKAVRYPANATFEQRLCMLQVLASSAPDRIALGLAHEVLYLRLAAQLRSTFPNATVGFGMGDESYRKLLSTSSYYRRLGLPWTPHDQQSLAELSRHVIVFARTAAVPGSLVVPESVRPLSSTGVRAHVRRLAQQALFPSSTPWLHGMVLPDVARQIEQYRLYR
jgi:cytidyltransferase-like protein